MWPFRKPTNVFDNVPGPSPWYLRADSPRLRGFSWKDLGADATFAGKTALVGPSGPVAIFDFHNYVSVLNERYLVVWHQQHVQSGPTAPVRIIVLDTHELTLIDKDLESACRFMTENKIPLLYNGATLTSLELDTSVADRTLSAAFPEPLAGMQELLILCHSSGVDPEPSWERSNLALLVANPSISSYKLYPQDWFNTANLDYGYQWVTRVVRDPHTQQVHGEGIRIAPFTLDKTLRSTVSTAAR
jgi:hypothetical protein